MTTTTTTTTTNVAKQDILNDRVLFEVYEAVQNWRNEFDEAKTTIADRTEREDFINLLEWRQIERASTYQYIRQMLVARTDSDLWAWLLDKSQPVENREMLERLLKNLESQHGAIYERIRDSFHTHKNGVQESRQAELDALQIVLKLADRMERLSKRAGLEWNREN